MELKGSKTEKNLMEAFAGESMARNKYTYYASKAKKDGYEQIAKLFEETAANEKEHAKIWFKYLHDGEVPSTLDELLTLPGVGRKTANVIQSVAFGKATLAVDTHVFRVAHRLGLVNKSDNTPYKVEMALTKYIPEEDIPNAHHWLLLHGRYVCTARKPHCEKCELEKFCAKIIS